MRCYRDPDLVGNSRNVIISDQAGKANLISQLNKLEINIESEKVNQILELIKQKEAEGFSYDTALASFELLVRRHVGQIKEYFNLNGHVIPCMEILLNQILDTKLGPL